MLLRYAQMAKMPIADYVAAIGRFPAVKNDGDMVCPVTATFRRALPVDSRRNLPAKAIIR